MCLFLVVMADKKECWYRDTLGGKTIKPVSCGFCFQYGLDFVANGIYKAAVVHKSYDIKKKYPLWNFVKKNCFKKIRLVWSCVCQNLSPRRICHSVRGSFSKHVITSSSFYPAAKYNNAYIAFSALYHMPRCLTEFKEIFNYLTSLPSRLRYLTHTEWRINPFSSDILQNTFFCNGAIIGRVFYYVCRKNCQITICLLPDVRK